MAVEVRQQFVEAEVNLMKDTIWRLTGRVFALESFIKKKFGDFLDAQSGSVPDQEVTDVTQLVYPFNCSKSPIAPQTTKKRPGSKISSGSSKKLKMDDKKVESKRELRSQKLVEAESSSSDDDLAGSSSDDDEEEQNYDNEQSFENEFTDFKVEEDESHNLEADTQTEHLISSLTTIVELSPGSGVYLNESDLSTAKFMANGSPNLLARHLFRRLYTLEELYGHSLFGRTCNANKNGKQALPPVDPKRKDAILAYCLNFHGYSLPSPTDTDSKEMKKGKEKVYNSMKREITKSLSDFMREVNIKHRRQKNSK